MNKKKIISLTILTSMLLLGGCAQKDNARSASQNSTSQTNISQIANTKIASQNSNSNQLEQLVNQDYQSGSNPIVIINDNKSTLNPNSWQTNHVEYQNLDTLNRTSRPVTAYLENRNLANDSLRVAQTWKPTGWQQKFDNHHNAILNRGHIIAYSVSKGIAQNGQYNPSEQSGDQNNPKNLFTQTAFSNQKLQTIYEQKVRDALKDNEKVIYQVQPIFKDNEKMARGVHMQAISTDGKLNFNVFIYNVQPGYKFDYSTGSSVIDNTMQVPLPDNQSSINSTTNANNYYNDHAHNNNNENKYNYNDNNRIHYHHKIIGNYHNYYHHRGFN